MVLRFSPTVAGRVQETRWHPSERVAVDADGRLTWEARVSGTLEIRSWILGWGAEVEVLGPPELRAEIAGIVSAAASVIRPGVTDGAPSVTLPIPCRVPLHAAGAVSPWSRLSSR